MKKKILFFINGLYGGGAERVLQTLLNNLDYDLYDVTVYSLKKESIENVYPKHICYRYIFDQYSCADSSLKQFYVKLKNKVRLFIYHHLSPCVFYRLFVKGTYDTEVAFIEGYATRIISGSNNRKSKKIAWVHTDMSKNHWTTLAYRTDEEEKKAYTNFDKVVSVSQSVKYSFDKMFPHHNSIVCYNPIDENGIKRRFMASVNTTEMLCRRPVIVTLGRLVPQKGYDRLLAVAKQLKAKGLFFSINILGEGNERTKLESYIKEHRLQDCVKLLGFQENPYPFLSKADLFVCSSRIEGYSTAVIESLVLGIPVVATNCSGMEELLGDNQYGMIVDNEEKSLYEGMKKILSDGECLDYYRLQAQERGKIFSLKHAMQEIEQIL